jgi:hypothetical protein
MEDTRDVIRQYKTLVGPFSEFNSNEASEYLHEQLLEWSQVAIDNVVHC